MKKNWVHIASGYPTDVVPCLQSKVPVIWVNRHGEEAEGKKPDAEVAHLPRRGQAAEGRLARFAGGLPHRGRPAHHERLLADQCRGAACRRRGDTRRLALPARRARRPAGAARGRGLRAGRPASPPTATSTTCSGGSPTRAWRSAWAQSTGDRLRASPGEPQRHLRHYDQDFYIERPAPLSLGQVQALAGARQARPRHGTDAIEIELHPAEGHTVDGMALFARPLGVLMVGDYVSSVEIPWIHGTLARLPLDAGAAATARRGGRGHRARSRPGAYERDGAAADRRGRRLPGRSRARRGEAAPARRARLARPARIHRENLDKVGAA